MARGDSLAGRFRTALEKAEESRRREEEQRQQRLAECRAARDALLADLEGFARAIGALDLRRSRDRLELRHGEHRLIFEAVGQADAVRVLIEGAPEDAHRLYREAALSDRWVWAHRRPGGEERLPLFDAGLEELMVRGLGLPRPSDSGGGRPL